MTRPLVISFYTTDNEYAAKAQRLIASCQRHEYDYHIVPMDLTSRRDWYSRVAAKGQFMLDCLQQFQRPILWLDADSEILWPMPMFDSCPFDFAASLRPQGDHLRSGIVYATMKAAGLLAQAAELCTSNPAIGHERNLDAAWRRHRNDLRTCILGPEYNYCPNDIPAPPRLIPFVLTNAEGNGYHSSTFNIAPIGQRGSVERWSPPARVDETLVIGPHVGEIGWELLYWQPMAYRRWLEQRPARTVVYCRPGRQSFYRFADELIEIEGYDYEPECLQFADMAAHGDEFRRLMDNVRRRWNTDNVVTPADVVFQADDLSYGSGDQLYADYQYGLRDHLVLMVRDRALAERRNWTRVQWAQLATGLLELNHPVVMVGRTRSDWTPFLPTGVLNLLNQTTLDEALAVLSHARLALGGSTGTMHLASRAGVNHLAWSMQEQRAVRRFYATNWFKADCGVLLNPSVDEVLSRAKDYLAGRRPLTERLRLTPPLNDRKSIAKWFRLQGERCPMRT